MRNQLISSSVKILGVKIDILNIHDLISMIRFTIDQRKKAIIVYSNIYALNLAYKLAWFRRFLNQADVNFCDGFGIRFGAAILGLEKPERFTPPDWVHQLSVLCVKHGYTIFFLGAEEGVAMTAAEKLQSELCGLKIVGTHHGFFDKTPDGEENRKIVKTINSVRPNILIVCFGMPLQEKWIKENMDQLEVNVILPAGALFDYLADNLRRPPKIMTDHGLEWFGRLFVEPRRLWRRYLIGNPLFFWRVLKQRFGLLKLPGDSNPPHGESKQHSVHH